MLPSRAIFPRKDSGLPMGLNVWIGLCGAKKRLGSPELRSARECGVDQPRYKYARHPINMQKVIATANPAFLLTLNETLIMLNSAA